MRGRLDPLAAPFLATLAGAFAGTLCGLAIVGAAVTAVLEVYR